MTTLCPNWDRLDRGEREKFWSSLLWSIAGPESGRNRTVIYLEPGGTIDSVTHQAIRSEGLLQLSYSDVPNYKYDLGDISWEKDREMALADYESGATRGNPERTLLNAYPNLNLGLWIMNKLLTRYTTPSFEDTLGKYWSTMRKQNSTFQKVMSGMKTRNPACY